MVKEWGREEREAAAVRHIYVRCFDVGAPGEELVDEVELSVLSR
jgi:hypothetical protein